MAIYAGEMPARCQRDAGEMLAILRGSRGVLYYPLARCWRYAGERLVRQAPSVGYFVTVDYSKHTRSIHPPRVRTCAAQQLVCCLLSVNLGDGVAPLPFGIVCSLRCTKAVKILTTASNLPLRTYTPRKLFTASRHAAGGGSGKYSEIWRDRDSRRRGDGSTSYGRAGASGDGPDS